MAVVWFIQITWKLTHEKRKEEKEMEMIQEYIVPITTAFCFMIGFAVKKFPAIDNKWIPLIVMVLGVVFNCWFNWEISPTVIVGGMASGLASTGIDQLVKQLSQKEKG